MRPRTNRNTTCSGSCIAAVQYVVVSPFSPLALIRSVSAFLAVWLTAVFPAGAQEAETETTPLVETVELGSESVFGADNMLGLIVEAGPVSWLVLLTLLGFSLVSWAIILGKSREMGRAERESTAFLQAFRKSQQVAEVAAAARRHQTSPLSRLFLAAQEEVLHQSHAQGKNTLAVNNMEAVARALVCAASVESRRLERRLVFLATTGGATPFIGLLGTVWGIMNAFQEIGFTQAANISVVAPGVSEALIATAAGLGAAIPAVIAYNALLARLRRIESGMDEFSMELTTRFERFAGG